jgi:MFS family permease
MMPGSIYLSLMTGNTIGSASWVTVIIFSEISRRALKTLNTQELVVLLYVAGAMATGGAFADLMFRQYFVNSDAARDSGLRGLFPTWWAPHPESAAIVERNLMHHDWLIPILIIVFLAQAILVGWLVGVSSSMTMLLLVGAGIGFMYGANLTLFPATAYDFFGLKNAGVNYGIIFTAWGVGGCIGNYVAGFAKTFWGGFGPAYTIAAVLCILGAGMTLVVKAPRAEVCATVPAKEVGEPA